MRQLGVRFLTLGKKSTSHGVSLVRNRRSRLSVECLERRDLLVVGTLTGVAYEIDAVTGTDYDGLPYMRSVESTGNLTTASDSLPIEYNEQFPPGYATMNGTVNFTFPQTVMLGQTASISASAQSTWNNSGLGFGRPTSIDISDGIGPDGLDDKGSFADGSTSAQVNWSDSVAVPTGPGSVTLPMVTVTVDGKEDKIITLTASYQFAQAPTVTGVSPQTGEPSGGTTVIVSGSGFTNASAVSFGGVAATGFTVDSGTQITATVPAGTGTVDVTVTAPAGTSATSGADQFTYVTGGLPQVEFAVANVDVYVSGNSVREVDAAVVNPAGSGASPIDAVVLVKPMAKTGGKKPKQAGTPVWVQLVVNPYAAALNGVITVVYYVDNLALPGIKVAQFLDKDLDTGTAVFSAGQTAVNVALNFAVNKIKGAQQQVVLALKSPVGAAVGTISQMYLDFINLQYGETQMKNLLKAEKRTGNTLRPLAAKVQAGKPLSASEQAKAGNLITILDGLNQTATTYAAIYRSDAMFDSTLEQFQTLYSQLYHLESEILAEYKIP